MQKSRLFEFIYVLNSHLKYTCKSIFDKKYLLYPAGSFYCNMKLLSNCPYSKKPPLPEQIPGCLLAYPEASITFTAFGALITLAVFVKFISTNLGIFQPSKVFFY